MLKRSSLEVKGKGYNLHLNEGLHFSKLFLEAQSLLVQEREREGSSFTFLGRKKTVTNIYHLPGSFKSFHLILLKTSRFFKCKAKVENRLILKWGGVTSKEPVRASWGVSKRTS